MNKDVVIKIKTSQVDLKGASDDMELVTKGEFYTKDDSMYIVYQETELSGMEGTTTMLKISDDLLVMKRYGSNTSKMVFEKGKRFKTRYRTSQGDLSMEILTNYVDISMNEDNSKIDIDLVYDINIAGIFEGKNKMNISIS